MDVSPLPATYRGEGPSVTIVPGFGISAWAYDNTVKVLARHAEVLVPEWLAVDGPFSYDRVVEALIATMDEKDIGKSIVVGHSYGGAIALGLAARAPERIGCLAFVGASGLSARWKLAYHARPGPYLWRLATFRAAVGFMRGAGKHPIRLAQAGLHAFFADMSDEIERVAHMDVPRHVLWAERDTLLPHSYGVEFARRLEATFTIVTDPYGEGPVDHDWLWRHPHLLEDQLERLDALPPRTPEETAERII